MNGRTVGRRSLTASILTVAILLLGLGRTTSAQTPPPVPGSNATQALVAVVVDPDGLNLRAGPGTEFPSLALIPQGAELTVRGERQNTNWLPVSYQGASGFVHDAYVALRPARVPGAAPAAPPSPAVGPSLPPHPSSRPALSPAMTLSDNGVTLAGVFAWDADGMITIADAFELTVVVRPPVGVTALTLRLSGAPFQSTTASFAVQPGDNWLTIPDFHVDIENEPVLREQVIRTVGGVIPMRDGALVIAVDRRDANDVVQTASFQPTVYDYARPADIARIEYPDLTRVTGLPPTGAGVDGFYLRGDRDFHHPDDFFVRKLAIEAGRRGGVFPDDPEAVTDNIYAYLNALLGDKDPGDFNNDYNMARLIDDGTIVRGQLNGGYICIGQIYLMTALTRTLGIPSRELNLAVAKPSYQRADGAWVVSWFQEAAVHVWVNGAWQLYDLWIGFKGIGGYLERDLAYQAWAAFDRQTVPFTTVNGTPTGLRGHDFNRFPGDPPQFAFLGEAVRPGVRVVGLPDDLGNPPVTDRPDGDGMYIAPGVPWAAGAPAGAIAAPPAAGIMSPSETRP